MFWIVNKDLELVNKLSEAVMLAIIKCPEVGPVIEKRLVAITPAYFKPQAGLVIENYEGLPVVGDYHILASRIGQLTLDELASRICAVAIILEMEEDMKPSIGTWKLEEEEIEKNFGSYVLYRNIFLS